MKARTSAVPPLFRYPVVVVIWDDAHARNQAVEYTEDEVRNLHRPEVCTTLGLVIREDSTGISLYTEETGPDVVRGANFIPAAMIKEVIHLGTIKRPKSRVSPRKGARGGTRAVPLVLQPAALPSDSGAEPSPERNSSSAEAEARMGGKTERE